MGELFTQAEQLLAEQVVDVKSLVNRLDREDVLLLRQFYYTGQTYPDDTECHVLCLLVDKLHRMDGPLAKLSYGAIRYRLENLVGLGLLGKVPQANPAIFEPLDNMVDSIRKIITLFAADFVGLWKKNQQGGP